MPYSPHRMLPLLPDDLKAYAAPRRFRMDYVWAATAAILAIVAWVQPTPTPSAPVVATAAQHGLLCPRWQDGLPLRGALQHCPDGTPEARWCVHECSYGSIDRRTGL